MSLCSETYLQFNHSNPKLLLSLQMWRKKTSMCCIRRIRRISWIKSAIYQLIIEKFSALTKKWLLKISSTLTKIWLLVFKCVVWYSYDQFIKCLHLASMFYCFIYCVYHVCCLNNKLVWRENLCMLLNLTFILISSYHYVVENIRKILYL